MENSVVEETRKGQDLHAVYHGLCDYLSKWYFTLRERGRVKGKKLVYTKRKFRNFDISEVRGYEAMCRIERFAKDHPEILVVGVDDAHHCGSSVFLIPHENEKEYWGTTVLFVPQCTSIQNEFFLYPHHLDNLVKELLKIQSKQKEKSQESIQMQMPLFEVEDKELKHAII